MALLTPTKQASGEAFQGRLTVGRGGNVARTRAWRKAGPLGADDVGSTSNAPANVHDAPMRCMG